VRERESVLQYRHTLPVLRPGVEHEGQEEEEARTGLDDCSVPTTAHLKRGIALLCSGSGIKFFSFLVFTSWSLPPERSRSLKAPRSSTYSPTRSRKSGSDCVDCEYEFFSTGFLVFCVYVCVCVCVCVRLTKRLYLM